jgi:hypothetical protein
MINVSIESIAKICSPAKAAALLLSVAGCLYFASMDRARAQESSVSCEEKCSIDQKQCIYNGSSEELCDYDYKMCKKACSEKK